MKGKWRPRRAGVAIRTPKRYPAVRRRRLRRRKENLMLRTIIIIVALCAGLAVLFTMRAPGGQGTLTLRPGPTFPADRKADLGRTIARIVPHCPGLARFGGEVTFTDLRVAGQETRVTFTVPELPVIPAAWGRFDAPCVYAAEGDILRISGAACQALCLGKPAEPPRDELLVDLNPQPQAQPRQ